MENGVHGDIICFKGALPQKLACTMMPKGFRGEVSSVK